MLARRPVQRIRAEVSANAAQTKNAAMHQAAQGDAAGPPRQIPPRFLSAADAGDGPSPQVKAAQRKKKTTCFFVSVCRSTDEKNERTETDTDRREVDRCEIAANAIESVFLRSLIKCDLFMN
jgi:hypothetical protein